MTRFFQHVSNNKVVYLFGGLALIHAFTNNAWTISPKSGIEVTGTDKFNTALEIIIEPIFAAALGKVLQFVQMAEEDNSETQRLRTDDTPTYAST